MYILNEEFYGLMLPTADQYTSLQQEAQRFEGLKIKYLGNQLAIGHAAVDCVLTKSEHRLRCFLAL